VRNWISAAQEGKLELQLYEDKGKSWVANTTKNSALIDKLVEKGKKFKNSRSSRTVSPTKYFYESFSDSQILDIISQLTKYNEIPTQYTYVDGAAKYWDDYATRLYEEQVPNILTQTVNLLQATANTIDHLIDTDRKVNVVDLGPGNGIPVKDTLERLLKEGRLNRYIAIDGSKEMLSILEQNIERWFDGQIKCESYVRDFGHERFDDLFINDYTDSKATTPVNLVYLLGGTLSNFRSPARALQTINSSMQTDDLLIYTGYLDTPNSRRYFDFNTPRPNQKLRSELILAFLGIDESLYEIEQVFDESKLARFGSFKPTVDLSIKFQLPNGIRHVELRKNEPILLWRHWHKNTLDIMKDFEENDFDLVAASKAKSREFLLLVTSIRANRYND